MKYLEYCYYFTLSAQLFLLAEIDHYLFDCLFT